MDYSYLYMPYAFGNFWKLLKKVLFTFCINFFANNFSKKENFFANNLAYSFLKINYFF